MREIKFEYGFANHAPICYTLAQIEFGLDFSEVGRVLYRRQYTGVKDRNGVEIYEGDIITAEVYPFYSDGLLNYVGVVGIDKGGVYYDLKRVSNRVAGRSCGGNISELGGHQVVIGNIYENPELLTTSKEEE